MDNRRIEEVQQTIINHHLNNIKHGDNCICMDQYIREVRNILGITAHEQFMREVPSNRYSEVLASEPYKAHQRWIYVLRAALRS